MPHTLFIESGQAMPPSATSHYRNGHIIWSGEEAFSFFIFRARPHWLLIEPSSFSPQHFTGCLFEFSPSFLLPPSRDFPAAALYIRRHAFEEVPFRLFTDYHHTTGSLLLSFSGYSMSLATTLFLPSERHAAAAVTTTRTLEMTPSSHVAWLLE